MEEDRPKPAPVLDQLEREDLSVLSREELEDRVRRLTAERERSEQALAEKANTRTSAEQFFRNR